MNRWKVEIDPAAEREPALDDRYRVVSRLRFLSGRSILILELECDEAAADELRRRPGILTVKFYGDHWATSMRAPMREPSWSEPGGRGGVGCSGEQGTEDGGMDRWDYLTPVVRTRDVGEELARLGAEGWELVSAAAERWEPREETPSIRVRRYRLFFKRPQP